MRWDERIRSGDTGNSIARLGVRRRDKVIRFRIGTDQNGVRTGSDTGGENQCPELEHCKYTVSKWTM